MNHAIGDLLRKAFDILTHAKSCREANETIQSEKMAHAAIFLASHALMLAMSDEGEDVERPGFSDLKNKKECVDVEHINFLVHEYLEKQHVDTLVEKDLQISHEKREATIDNAIRYLAYADDLITRLTFEKKVV
jgi:hypothetical protein